MIMNADGKQDTLKISPQQQSNQRLDPHRVVHTCACRQILAQETPPSLSSGQLIVKWDKDIVSMLIIDAHLDLAWNALQ